MENDYLIADHSPMRGQPFYALLPAAVAIAGCGGGDGAGALRGAAVETRAEPYVVISQGAAAERPGGQLLVSRRLLVIRARQHVVAWTARAYELTWRASRRCYERHTDFNRDDVRQERQGLLPANASRLHVHRRDGATVVSGKVGESTDSPAAEFELTLDGQGRADTLRERSARFGAVPASRWRTVAYRYPTAAEFAKLAGPPPGPRCS